MVSRKNGVSQCERDYKMLFEVTFKMKGHTQPRKPGELCSIFELNSLQSPIVNKAVTVTLAVDQLHLLQHATSQAFDHLITIAQDVFKAPEQDVSLIYVLVKLSEENFPFKECQQLCYRLKAESCFGDQFKEFNGNSIEIKSEHENETCTPNVLCSSDEQSDESLVSGGSTSSLNWIPISSSNVIAMEDYPLRRSPSVSEEASIESKGNTYKEEYASPDSIFLIV